MQSISSPAVGVGDDNGFFAMEITTVLLHAQSQQTHNEGKAFLMVV